jgi:predicted nucleic acid-binding protein
VTITGTVGLLERAADQGLLDLSEAFERVKRTDFWVRPALLDERLRQHRVRRHHT